MTGYSGFSKSNNAVAAEADGLMTATALAKRIKRGVTAADVKAIMRYAEKHHTSKMYNMTEYYGCPMLSELKAIIQHAADRKADRRMRLESCPACGRKKVVKTHCWVCGASFK